MFIEIDQLKINYQQTGEGRPVVLLHGWGTSLDLFEDLQNALASNFQVTSLDFPGFGQSDEPPESWDVGQYTDFLEKFFNKLNINNPILLGHSFGGRVSIKYADRHQEGVHKIILIGSAGVKPKRKMDYYLKVYTYKAMKKVLSLPILNRYKDDIIGQYRGRAGSADYQNASRVMQQTLSKVVNEDLQHHMPNIKAPTLLIWGGENDTSTPPVHDAKVMEDLIPNAGLALIQNAGHYVFLEQKRRVAIIIDTFLEEDKGAV
ncbi:alpha/beta hydrolase fold [Gracilibacillus boraciitolerans JCM 21714]|uniref:Alpha/beta hydrolase fold n=1 Tax=Gracilibacillus boraciitolerans JCM 21714 TaxID=1298598 RepID=W4VNX3_9BACI|nr:alpha/beta hydrolase [Gracilibacillus boraciitolerans]GAE94876.1 alpha/beta hydrolase fold [Gracilibacillus boraciitolerans JCM 21714]